MAFTPADFKARFPIFSAESDARVQIFIDDAGPSFDVVTWGDFYSVGIANFVAHSLTLSNYTTTANAMSSNLAVSKKVGEVAVTYSQAMIDAGAADPFMRTSFGQMYLYYLRLVGAGALAV